jgi:iron complex outermembrane receptor protein
MSGYAAIPSALFCATSLLALACAQAALAQGGDQPMASNPSGLEEIVVTARRREEKLQSVPLAITALNAHDLEEHEVQTTTDLQHLVPSFTVNVGALYRDSLSYTLRGQGSTQGPSVVVYFAEVPSVANGSGPGQYYDLESVQVLKGPQGTLFGRNTTGGAVLFEPQKPTNDFEGYAKLTLGNYNWHEAEGAVNVPIVSDKVLLRVAGNVKERDGFTKDVGPFFNGKDYDNVDYWAGRASLTIRPTDDLENYAVFSSIYNHNNGPGSSLLVVNPNFRFGTLLGLPITLGGNGPTPASLATNFAANFAAAKAAGRFSAYPNLEAVLAAQQANGPRETALSTDQIAKG